MNKQLFLISFLGFGLVLNLFGQMYAPSPLEAQNNNPTLGQLTVGENIGNVVTGDIGQSAYWATSFLPPEGAPPEQTDTSNMNDDDLETALADYAWLYDTWTNMYGPSNVSDGDTKTAWCEGVEGYGEGEVLLIKVDTSKPVSIWTGFGRTQKDFLSNSRPRKVRVWVLQAGNREATQNGEYYTDVTALASREMELQDINGWQPLPLPTHKLRNVLNPHYEEEIAGSFLSFVALEIITVYPGSKYKDTLISEVGNP